MRRTGSGSRSAAAACDAAAGDSHSWKCEAEIPLPCREVTACAFGGPDLGDLYITTGKPPSEIEPLAGRLFVTRPGVRRGVTFADTFVR